MEIETVLGWSNSGRKLLSELNEAFLPAFLPACKSLSPAYWQKEITGKHSFALPSSDMWFLYASMQTNDPKADLRRLHWDLFRLPSNYLGTGLYNTRVVSLMQALHFPTAVKRLHLHLFPGSWLSSEFSSLSYQVAGTGLAITYSIVLFPPPHFWPSAMWISLKKTQQTITFSLSLSCPPFRCYTKGLPFNSQQTESQNCKAAFQFEGINASKTREWK